MVKTINGIKFYPVCNKERNYHKIDYWYTKALLGCYDSDWKDDKAHNDLEESEKLLNYFQSYTGRDGLVYAPYKDGQRIKEMIVCYDLCH